jgi:hypothetical protein
MSAADRDRCEEEEQEFYDTVFEAVHARKVRQYYEDGGNDPDFKPSWQEIHIEVQRALDARQSAGAREAAEDRADVARMFSKI